MITVHVMMHCASVLFLPKCLTPYNLVNYCELVFDVCAAIYSHVLKGNVLKAIELTNQLAVDLLASNRDVHFDLLTLHFVELVRAKDWYDLNSCIVRVFIFGVVISVYQGFLWFV